MNATHRGRRPRLLFACALATLGVCLPAAHAAAASLSINDVTRNEGNTATTAFTFTVTLTDPPATGNVMVRYTTADGSASAGACATGADYVSTSGQLTFNRNNLERKVDVLVCGDTIFEPDETFSVNLFQATGDAVIAKGTGTRAR